MKLAGLVQIVWDGDEPTYHWRMFPRMFGRYRDIIIKRGVTRHLPVPRNITTIYPSSRSGVVAGESVVAILADSCWDALRKLGYERKIAVAGLSRES